MLIWITRRRSHKWFLSSFVRKKNKLKVHNKNYVLPATRRGSVDGRERTFTKVNKEKFGNKTKLIARRKWVKQYSVVGCFTPHRKRRLKAMALDMQHQEQKIWYKNSTRSQSFERKRCAQPIKSYRGRHRQYHHRSRIWDPRTGRSSCPVAAFQSCRLWNASLSESHRGRCGVSASS